MIELPFIPGIIVFLIIITIITRVHMEIANFIGEMFRLFFTIIWKSLRKLMG